MILRPAIGGQPPQMVFVTIPNIPAPQPDPPELSASATQVFNDPAGVVFSPENSADFEAYQDGQGWMGVGHRNYWYFAHIHCQIVYLSKFAGFSRGENE